MICGLYLNKVVLKIKSTDIFKKMMILHCWLSVLNSGDVTSLSSLALGTRHFPTKEENGKGRCLLEISVLFRSSKETDKGKHQNFSFTALAR